MVLLLIGVGSWGCGEVAAQDPDASGNTNENDNTCVVGASRCFGGGWQQCAQEVWVDELLCLPPTAACDDELGCLECSPGERYCDGDTVRQCTQLGTPGAVLETCEAGAGESCSGGECLGACEAAVLRRDYIGCEYWPTPTTNSALGDEGGSFADNFGVVVHNANELPATVTIAREGAQVAQATVAPGEMHTFELPMSTGLSMPVSGAESLLAAGAAYHLTSSLPVTVYQFNPLDYELGGNHSYSNDASLLLPSHVLTGDYVVMARQTSGVRPVVPDGQMFFAPGFVAVVGTVDHTVVTITSSAFTASGSGVAALSPGEQRTFTVGRGEVLQLVSEIPEECTGTLKDNEYCDMGAPYDLTGSIISASAPVAVFSGHDCSFVPFDAWACDHLEEQLPPLQTWGKEFIVARTESQHDAAHPEEPNLLRFVSGADDNHIVLDPPLPGLGGSLTLHRGQWREVRTYEDVHVRGTGPLMIGQFMVGQSYYSPGWMNNHGDPSFGIVVPLVQYRRQYTFLAPDSIPLSYVNVIKPVSGSVATVYLDGEPLAEQDFSPAVGGSPFGVARVIIDGGGHVIESAGPVGISVYGFARFTSYLYPGGLNLNHVNPVK
ncbi:MAG: IgGFc-binding protein [bacterium]